MKGKNSNLNVVGIGASAGGLDTIQSLFDHIPEDTGMAFVIIQHLSPDFKSLMPELLSKHTNMPIFTAEDKQSIAPNCIYLNQNNTNLHIKGNKLYLLDKGPKHNLNLPIDIFFHTLGEEYKDKAIGVILSGTGSDGSRGIRTIKECGGTILVQDPNTAQFDGMPNSAIATNTVDCILTPEGIAEVIHKTPINKQLVTKDSIDNQEVNASVVREILTNVYKFSGIDFREYKKNTLLRRIEKRMHINNIEFLFDYATFLASNEKEKHALKEDFLIGVTRFFRDKEAFKKLKELIIPGICKSKKPGDAIRIWVSGCSTGEEVYSIAILLDDYINIHSLNLKFKIFATDIDPRGLSIASVGTYSINVINEIEQPYVEHYFIRTGDKVQIVKHIREKIVFSSHNLIKDPPFIKMDLISCRNLLIYLDNNIQKRVLLNFQFALNRYSYLFLGSSESLGPIASHFKILDVKWKIYQNISPIKIIPSQNTPKNRLKKLPNIPPIESTVLKKYKVKENPETIYHKYLSDKNSPSSIFIDKGFNILFIKGNAGKRLIHKEGVFEKNLLKVLSIDTASIVRSGVRRLKAKEKDVVIKDIKHEVEGVNYSFDLTFHKPKNTDELNNSYLIEFSEDTEVVDNEPIVIKNINVDKVSSERLEDLEYELKVVKTELQNTIEELETSNEELQSSNEELMASNEELQSTNEELQSVNEELYTVNSEMQEKNKELTNLSNDVTNLLDNTEIATLFLDTDLRIRKFTPALKEVFNLQKEDLGRPLSSFTSNFYEDTRISIIDDSKLVLKKLITVEKQLQDKNGNFYLQRISPFIISNKIINGVVITFYNINNLKKVEKELAVTDTRYRNLFENLNEGFLHAKIIKNKKGQPIDWRYIGANPAFEKLIGLKNKDFLGNRLLDILPYIKDDPTVWISKFGETAITGKEQYIDDYSTPEGKHYHVHLFSPNQDEFAATFADVTELKNKKEALLKSEAELTKIQEITKVGSWYLDLETNKVTWSLELYKMYGFDPALPPPNYTEHQKLFTKESWLTLSKAVERTQITGIPYELELKMIKENGECGWLWARGEAVKNANGKIIALRGAAQNVTQRKLNQEELIKAKKVAEDANNHKNYFLANMSHEIRTPMNGVLGFSELLKNDKLSKKERLKYLEIIDGNSKQLLNLIDDIIDIAKIESNEIKIVYKECQVSKLINNLEITFNQLKKDKNKTHINFKTFIPKAYENLVIITDPQRLQQVICNLLNNALKFSEQGEIAFGYEVEGANLKFFVRDEGIGIDKNNQAEIFERFKQINYENNAKYGGTGLGLAICRGIVELLGGNIKLKSELQKGTVFEFTIPLKFANSKTKQEPCVLKERDLSLNDKTILIAEDDALIQLLFQVVLKDCGAKLIFAENGVNAIKMYKENKDIDIVLLDIRMPEMNGLEALDKILSINPNAKIIMQTAHVMPDEKEKCFNKGAVDFLSKPIVKEELFNTLNKWVN